MTITKPTHSAEDALWLKHLIQEKLVFRPLNNEIRRIEFDYLIWAKLCTRHHPFLI